MTEEEAARYPLATLTPKQIEAVVWATCPACKVGVPQSSISTSSGFHHYHHLDGKQWDCKGWRLREAIYTQQRCVEAAQEKDELSDILENGT
jgi:hypothetical protein